MPGVDLNYFMRQANELTKKIEQRKESLNAETVEGQAGDGRVKVTVTCEPALKSIKIDPTAIDAADPSMLEDLLVAAVNAGLEKARVHSQQELAKISKGIKIPGIT